MIRPAAFSVALNLNGIPITGKGLQQLHCLKHLKRLSLYVTHVTPAGVEDFKRAVPGCDVLFGSRLSK